LDALPSRTASKVEANGVATVGVRTGAARIEHRAPARRRPRRLLEWNTSSDGADEADHGDASESVRQCASSAHTV